ncbi:MULTISPECIES: beta-glucosidase [Actinomyces]|uniref:Glycoside hydrolase family 3 C-terminal domain-containing protein n=1 Tax=Actinomyces respiraculi TaxID=2744574 RepID=A0A7T0LJM0_9ACTO|nr:MULTISPECIES: glycoside hydrolase family 3 C-terminal domain-containing protein [Actinomyces]QPL04616.1 glycoside hydrolase family 3 C-terminal domain-containing protein [Actinomyces respiraculi]
MTVNASDLSLIEAAALLSGASEWDSRALPARGIRSFVMSDGPHGVRRQLGSGDHLGIAESEPATCFPTAAALACSWDPALAEEMGAALGQEARALGVDVLLGPGLNIKRSPLCGRNFEYYSEDPLLAGRMAAGLVRGIQSQGVAATPKHFAVNSQELRRMSSDSVVDERTMREIYLTAFEIVVREAHPRALMSAYNRVNGVYANENRHLLTEILREEWGYDGLVVSDWGGSNDAAAAAGAGSSLEMPAPGLYGARAIVRAVMEGRLSRQSLRERATEVIAMSEAALSHGERPALEAEAHHDVARRVAEQSIVLLKNDDAVLPLVGGTRVAVIGDMAATPRYQGSGSSQINPTRLETFLDVVGDSDLDVVGYAPGYDRQGADDEALVREAVELARRSDVVLAWIGLDELSESEGLDRSHMRLPAVQTRMLQAVAEANPKVVVVLSAGSAVETAWEAHARAVIHTSLSGQAGASAALHVLTGEVNPSGRLAETYPVSYEDHPTSAWFPATGELALYTDGPYVGYRYFQTAGVEVAHPFGFGLSYSTFDYSDLRVDADGASVTVTNTSEVDGAEVVQLYVSPPQGVWGPVRELKGFAKVMVPAGASVTVTIPFDEYTFRHYSTAAGAWRVTGGAWTVLVGRNVEDLPLEAVLDVEGEAPEPADPALGAYLTGRVDQVGEAEFAALLGRPVPTPAPDGEIGPNDPLSAMSGARSRLARTVAAFLTRRRAKADATGKPDLNILFVLNMPLRATSKMTRGAVSDEMVGGLVDLVNGHTLRGLRAALGGYVRNRRADKAVQRVLDHPRR